ncbi:MAG: RluA family pseudouridine synthase [Phycisphaerales bacterium]|nr:RluA family pseudouridine synthase [Phycisphaerales bacterium]
MNSAPDPDQGNLNRELLDPGGKVDREALYRLYEERDDDETPIRVRFALNKNLQKRLDRYLVDRVPFMSRTALQRLIDEEQVTINGKTPKASTKLKLGDVVEAVLPPPPSNQIPPEDIPLSIIHEDADLVVINKQPDIIVHPARGYRTGTIINALSWHFQHRSGGELSSVGEEFARPGVVHRLDRWTTGAMVAAKSDLAHWRIGDQFQERTVNKRYLAVVHGVVETPMDEIDMPIGKHPRIFDRYAVRFDEFGKSARTIYRVRERYDGYTLLELQLLTGRTHQIRVHLAHIGHPIVGDDYYGGRKLSMGAVLNKAEAEAEGFKIDQPLMARQALHAALLEFDHPMTGERTPHLAPLWPDMQQMVALLRTHRPGETLDIPGTQVDLTLE